MEDIMSKPEIWNLVSSGYETETMPSFVPYVDALLEHCHFTSGNHQVLDLACGPGTLALQIFDKVKKVTAIDFAPEMLDIFRRIIQERQIQNIDVFEMDGQQLSFADQSFDFGFSNFGLIFFPRRNQGLKELFRVLKPGGRIGISSWAPPAESTLMQIAFGAFMKAFPPASESGGQTKGPLAKKMDDVSTFQSELEAAGFIHVQIKPFKGYWQITNLDEFMDSMEKGTAPIAMAKKNNLEVWPQKRKIMIEAMQVELGQLPVSLYSTAYLACAEKPF